MIKTGALYFSWLLVLFLGLSMYKQHVMSKRRALTLAQQSYVKRVTEANCLEITRREIFDSCVYGTDYLEEWRLKDTGFNNKSTMMYCTYYRKTLDLWLQRKVESIWEYQP